MVTKPPKQRRKRKVIMEGEIKGALYSLSAYAGTKDVQYYLEVPTPHFLFQRVTDPPDSNRVRILVFDRRKQRCYEVSQWENVYPIRFASGEYRYRKCGYLRVSLQTEHGKKKFYVHRLVALVCCPNDDPEHKKVTDHRDGNPQNNLPSNLEWVTPEENNNRRLALRGWKPFSDKQREQARRQKARYSRAHRIRMQRMQESDLFNN